MSAVSVAKQFVQDIESKAIGQDVIKSIRPGDALIKIVNDELIHLLGDDESELDLTAEPPAIILLAGLQGAGKTTTAAKLAKRLKEKEKKNVMLASVDVYRPAAIEQLKTNWPLN